MNAMVSSPVDALVFDYVSFGFFTIVNNLWTWVAVITAALSFWRIRAGVVSVSVKSEPPTSACIDSRNASDPVPEAASRHEPQPSTVAPSSAAAVSPAPSGLHENGATKGKFVVYYREEDRERDGNSEDEAVSEVTVGGEWWECWDRVLRARNGDGGWYRYQDSTVINGNVVRLWDGVRREKYSSGCCGVW